MYAENAFVMLALPLLVSLLFVDGRSRLMPLFTAGGMLSCLLAAYVNVFFVRWVGADEVGATVEVAPVVEEAIKLLPLSFYLFVLEPPTEDVNLAVVSIAVGFATMESAFYLADYGLSDPLVLALRGLGTALMHLSCGAVVGYGLMRLETRPWLRAVGIFCLLCMAATYHGLFNLLVEVGGPARMVAVALPTAILVTIGWLRMSAAVRRG